MCKHQRISMGIELDNPQRTYLPGSEVSGVLVLHLEDPVKARKVTIDVNGRAHTYWTEQERYYYCDAEGNQRTAYRTIRYSATVTHASGEEVVWVHTAEQRFLPRGRHHFAFRFILPATCAPSFDSEYGDIRYHIHANIDRPWKLDKECERYFTVITLLDLNTLPQSIRPVVAVESMKTGMVLFRHGILKCEAHIPKMGFVPGETVPINVFIDNNTTRPILGASARIVSRIRCYAVRHGWSAHYRYGLHVPSDDSRVQRRTLVSKNQGTNIAPNARGMIQFLLKIPAAMASFNMDPIITLDYYVEVCVEADGNVNNVLSTEAPLVIGSIPLRTSQIVATVPLLQCQSSLLHRQRNRNPNQRTRRKVRSRSRRKMSQHPSRPSPRRRIKFSLFDSKDNTTLERRRQMADVTLEFRLTPKRFKFRLNPQIFVYHPLPHKEKYELVREWKAQEERRKRRQIPIYRLRFTVWHRDQQNVREHLERLMKNSNISDMGEAKQWYYVMQRFPFDYKEAERRSHELRLRSRDRLLSLEILEWIWCAERLSFLFHHNGHYGRDERERVRKLRSRRREKRLSMTTNRARLLKNNSMLCTKLRLYFEERRGLLFNYDHVKSLIDPKPRDVKELMLRLIHQFTKEVNKKFVVHLPKNETKRKMFDITLIQEATKAAFTSIQGYLRMLQSMKNLVVVDCSIVDRRLTFTLEQIKEQFKAPIMAVSRIEWVRLSAEDVDEWAERAALIVEGQLDTESISNHPSITQYSHLIADQKIPAVASESELLALHRKTKMLQFRLQKAPKLISCHMFSIRMDAVWSVVQQRLRTTIHSLTARLRRELTEHLTLLLAEFRRFERALLFRSINPALMLANKATVDFMVENEISPNVDTLVAVFDRIFILTQHISLDPSQHDLLVTLASLRVAVPQQMREHQHFFDKRRSTFVLYVNKKQSTVLANVQRVVDKLKILQAMGSPQEAGSYLKDLAVVRPIVDALITEIDDLNKYEKVVGVPITDVPRVRQTAEDVRVMEMLFEWTEQFIQVMNDFFESRRTAVNIGLSRDFLDEYLARLAEYESQLAAQRSARHFIVHARNDVDTFKKNFAVAEVMSCNRLLDRHWTRMSEIVGFDLSVHANSTVAVLCELGLEEWLVQLKPIAFQAEREALVADQLDSVIAYWTTAQVETRESCYWRLDLPSNLRHLSVRAGRDSEILSGSRDAEDAFSQQNETISKWIWTVSSLQDLLNSWNRLLEDWLRVARIFETCKGELESEFVLLRRCAKYWRRLSTILRSDSSVLRLLDLKHAPCWMEAVHNHMDVVVKGVRVHLNSVRLWNPRLCVSSDHDLLALFSSRNIEIILSTLLREGFPSLRRLAFNRRDQLEMADSSGDKLTLDTVTRESTEPQSASQLIATIETAFANKVTEILLTSGMERGRSIPKMLTSLAESLEMKTVQDAVGISRLDKVYFFQHRSLGRQSKLVIDFIHYEHSKKLPASLCDNWARGKFPVIVGSMSDTRHIVQVASQRMFSCVKFINCHDRVEAEIFDVIVQASLKESILIVLENIDQLSTMSFMMLTKALAARANDAPFPRLLMSSTVYVFPLPLPSSISIESAPSKTIPMEQEEELQVTISPTAFELSSGATPLTTSDPLPVRRKPPTPQKSPIEKLREDLKNRSVSGCAGPMAKTILKEALKDAIEQVDWIYVDGLSPSQLLSPSKGFGCRAEGLLLEMLADTEEKADEVESISSYRSTLTSSSILLKRIVVFYGHDRFWNAFPMISTLFQKHDVHVIPPPFLTLFDGSLFSPGRNTHCVFCIPDDKGIRIDLVRKFDLPFKSFGREMKLDLAETYRTQWKQKFVTLFEKPIYFETMDAVVDRVLVQLTACIPNLHVADIIMSVIHQELSEVLPNAKSSSLSDVIRTASIVVTANFLAVYTPNREIIDEKVTELLPSVSSKSSAKIPSDLTSWKLSNQDSSELVRWIDEPFHVSSMDKESPIRELMVVWPSFDRCLHFGVRMLSLGRNLIVNGPPFTQKTTLVKMLEKELSHSGAVFEWLGSQSRVGLENVQRRFARIVEETRQDESRYIVIDKFSFAEPLLPVIELFVDHSMYFSEGQLKSTNTNLKFILITEEDDWMNIERSHVFWGTFCHLPMRSLTSSESRHLVERLVAWNFSTKSFSSEYQKLLEPLANSIVHLATRNYVNYSSLPVCIRFAKSLFFSFPDNTPDTDAFLRLWLHETLRVIGDAIDVEYEPELVKDIRFLLKTEFNTTEETLLDALQAHRLSDSESKDASSSVDLRFLLFSEMDVSESIDGLCYMPVADMGHFNRTIENFLFEHHRNHPRDRILLAIDDSISLSIQRICRVSRQSAEHLCLAGPAGSGRTQTVRLATTAHNAVLLHLYPDPSSFDSFMQGWQDVFLRAIQSISISNQPVNLLVHMDFCYERVEPRWMEYVRLWLEAPQTTGILGDEQLLSMGEQIIEAEKSLASQMQSVGMRLPGQRMCKFLAIEVLKEPSQLRKVLEARLHDFLHVIFLVHPQFKTDFSWCTVVHQREPSPNDLPSICSKVLADCKITSVDAVKVLLDVFHVASKYLTKIHSIPWSDRLVKGSSIAFHLCDTFQRLYLNEKLRLSRAGKQVSDALSTVSKIRELGAIGDSVDAEILNTRLTRAETALADFTRDLHVKSHRLEDLLKRTKAAEDVVEKYNSELVGLQETLDTQLKSPQDEFRFRSSAVVAFSSADFKKFSLLQKPSLGTRYVAEVLRVLFTDNFKPKRNTMETWQESQKLIRTSGLVNRIATFDPDSLSLSSIKILRKYVENREFRSSKIESDSELAAAICQWTYSVVSLACTSSLLREKQDDVRELRKAIDELEGNLSRWKEEIEHLQSELEQLSVSRREGEISIANDRKLNDYRNRSGGLLKQLEPFEQRWLSQRDLNILDQSHLIADCAISAGFETMVAGENLAVKGTCIQLWQESLKSHRQIASPTNTNASHLMTQQIRSLPSQRRFVVLVDEGRGLLSSLQDLFPHSTTVDVKGLDWNGSELAGSIVKYIYSGTPTIFYNMTSCPPVSFYEILSKWEEREVRFRDRLLELPDDALLIFIANENFKMEPQFRRIVDVFVVNESMETVSTDGESDSVLLGLLSELSASDILESHENTQRVLMETKKN